MSPLLGEANKENHPRASNVSKGQSDHGPLSLHLQPEKLLTQAREFEMQFKSLSFQTSKLMQSILKILREVNSHRIWRGEECLLPIEELEDKFRGIPNDHGLGECLLSLFRNINGYVDMSRESYAKQLKEIQSNHQKIMSDTCTSSHLQYSRWTNEMKTALDDVSKEKSKLEQQVRTQRQQYEKQLKEIQESKSTLQAELEGKLKHLKHQLEMSAKTHKDELLKEKNAVKEAEERSRQRSTDIQRKVTNMSRKLVSPNVDS